MKTKELKELLIMILPSNKKHTTQFIDQCIDNAIKLNLVELSPKEEILKIIDSIITENDTQKRGISADDIRNIKKLIQEI